MSYRSSWMCPLMVAIVVLAIPTGEGCAATASGVRPALPHEYVDTTVKSSPGRTLTVPAGGDFQAMLDEAQPGDEIVLTAGARYKGPFTLPYKKAGSGWITIRSGGIGKDFPAPGTRVQPSQAGRMAALVSNQHGVILAEPRAHHYRFIGIGSSLKTTRCFAISCCSGTIPPGLSTTCLTTSFSIAATCMAIRRKDRAAAS